jgi:ABC-type arginine transport system ATPase subunit
MRPHKTIVTVRCEIDVTVYKLTIEDAKKAALKRIERLQDPDSCDPIELRVKAIEDVRDA